MICKKVTGAPEPEPEPELEVEVRFYCHPYRVSCHCKGSPLNVMHDINKCLSTWFFFLFGTSRKTTAIDVSTGDQNGPQVMRIMKPFENDVAEQYVIIDTVAEPWKAIYHPY